MSQQFNEAQIQLLKKIFDKWDADQDGQITTKEMSTYYKSFRKNIDLEDIENEKETVLMDFTGVKTAACTKFSQLIYRIDLNIPSSYYS